MREFELLNAFAQVFANFSGNFFSFLNDGFKQVGGTYHEKKPDHIYLNIKGWFPNHIAQEAIDYLTEHMEAEVRKEQSAAQQEA